MWNPGSCDCECNKACKIDECLDIINCSYEKHLIGKLVLACEGEILNTTETLLNDKKVAYSKSDCRFYTISLVIICVLLLVIICVSCYIYYTKY